MQGWRPIKCEYKTLFAVAATQSWLTEANEFYTENISLVPWQAPTFDGVHCRPSQATDIVESGERVGINPSRHV